MKKVVTLLCTAALFLSLKASQEVHSQESALPFFGQNTTLLHLMEDGLHFRKDMMRTKEQYLDLYEKQFHTTALEARIKAEHAFKYNRDGYEAGVAWRILRNGYFDARQKAKQMRLQKSILFERDIETMIANYSKVAYYEIEDIKQTISFYYVTKRNRVLGAARERALKQLRRGMITRMAYDKIDTAWQKSTEALEHLYSKSDKPFDTKYRNLISTIEHRRLISVQKLKALTLHNAPSLKIEAQKDAINSLEDDWQSHVEAEIFLERKSYTFIEREETLGGVQLRIPLQSYDKSDALLKLERAYSRKRLQSRKLYLEKEVDYLYDAIDFHRERIAKIDKEIAFYTGILKQCRYKMAHPLQQSREHLQEQIVSSQVKLLELEEAVWIERADILGALLKLQYISGVRLL